MARKALLVIIPLLIFCFQLQAQTWEALPGLYGARAYSMAESNGRLFAATESGLYYSVDQAKTWVLLYMGHYQDVVSNEKGEVYAAGTGIVLYSSDGGINFKVQTAPPPSQFYVVKIRILPNSKALLLLGSLTETVIYISEDFGVTWKHQSAINSPFFSSNVILNGSTILVSFQQQGLMVSEDEGKTFTLRNDLPNATSFQHGVLGLTQDSKGTLYRASQEHIYRSFDKGNSWEEITFDLPKGYRSGLVGVNHKDELFHFSIYHGKTFKLSSAENKWIVKAMNFPFQQTFYYSTFTLPSGFFLCSQDNGINKVASDETSFPFANQNILPSHYSALKVINDDPKKIMASTTVGVGKYENGQWTFSTTDQEGFKIQPWDLHVFSNKDFFAAPSHYSSDGGNTWNRIPHYIQVGATADSVLYGYASEWNGSGFDPKLYHSADFGKSWLKQNVTNVPALSITNLTGDENYIYMFGVPLNSAEALRNLYRINRKTLSAEQIASGLEGFWTLSLKNGTFYARTPKGVARSDDGGATWKIISSSVWGSYDHDYELIGETIWLKTQNLQYSLDKGETWVDVASPSPPGWVAKVDIDDEGYVYVGVGYAGIFKSAEPLLPSANTNTRPVASNFQLETKEDITLAFSSTHFISTFSDADAGDVLTKILVTSLPENGILKLNDVPIALNQVIEKANIDALKFTPARDFFGDTKFQFKPSDGKNYATDPTEVSIVISPVNDAPAFTITTSLQLDEDFTQPVKIKPTQSSIHFGEQSETILYALTLPPSLDKVSVNFSSTTGEIILTSRRDQHGEFEMVLTANDGQSENNTYAQTIKVNIRPVDEPPEFTIPSVVELEEDFNGTRKILPEIEIDATSPAPVFVFTLSPVNNDLISVSVNSVTGEISLKSLPDKFGEIVFHLSARTEGGVASRSVRVIVNPVNDPPVFKVNSPVFLKEDFIGEVKITPQLVAPAFGENNQQVEFSVTCSAPEKISISLNKTTGEIVLTSNPNQFGELHLVLIANDQQSENNLYSEKINVVINPEQEKAFPNPVKDELTVLISKEITGEYEITLVDHAGRIRFQTTSQEKVIRLPMANLEPGIYFVTIRDAQGNVNQMKIVKG